MTIGERTAALEMKALAADGEMVVSVGGLDHSFMVDRPAPLGGRDTALPGRAGDARSLCPAVRPPPPFPSLPAATPA